MDEAPSSYSRRYYQANKDKFRVYYQRFREKQRQIRDGTYLPPPPKKPPTPYERDVARHARIQKQYEKRREEWLKSDDAKRLLGLVCSDASEAEAENWSTAPLAPDEWADTDCSDCEDCDCPAPPPSSHANIAMQLGTLSPPCTRFG